MARRTASKSSASPQQERTRRRLSELKPHPRQDEWFAPLSEPELNALAESMQRDGLQHPIHILPSGEILAGHQRLKAAQQLGWEMIDVVVRHDLANDEAAASMFALTDNLHRRQMGPLEIAVAYKSLRELERQGQLKERAGEEHFKERADLRDRLARHLGKSGRQLDRYLRLLDLPRLIQLAISQRRLPVSMAERLFTLNEDKRRLAAEQIELGEDPREVLQRFVPDRRSQPRSPRIEKPGLAEAEARLNVILSFLNGGLASYIQFVERQGGDNAACLQQLREVRSAAHDMQRRPGRYIRDARQLT